METIYIFIGLFVLGLLVVLFTEKRPKTYVVADEISCNDIVYVKMIIPIPNRDGWYSWESRYLKGEVIGIFDGENGRQYEICIDKAVKNFDAKDIFVVK